MGINKLFENFIYKETERLFLWCPVIFALGIGLYFSLSFEPPVLPIYLFSFLIFSLCVYGFYIGAKLRYILMILSIFAAGFLVAKIRINNLDVEILSIKKEAVVVQGRVINAEFNSRGNLSLILDDVSLLDRNKKIPRDKQKKELFQARIKLSVLKYNQVPQAGDIIEVFATLSPPPMPSHPEGFHYGRHLWFKKIGATAIALSSLKFISKSEKSHFLNSVRDSIHKTILNSGNVKEVRYESKAEYERSLLSQKTKEQLYAKRSSAIATALITGKRGAIDKSDYAAMRDAGLAHVLAISGLHMGLLCGAIFFMTRLILTHIGSFALFYPVKKYAAATAIVGGGYICF